jgi:hypothetical protein
MRKNNTKTKVNKIILLFIFLLLNSFCYSLEINDNEYKYEKVFFGNCCFNFEFQLQDIQGSLKIEKTIKELIYNNMNIEEYVLYKEKKFIEDVKKEDYPHKINEDGTEYLYESDYIEKVEIQYFNNSFVIIRYNNYFYRSGDAHGNTQITYYIIDLNKKKIWAIDDLIKIMPEEELKYFIGSKYSIDFNYSDSLWPPDSISFSKSGLILCWNTYTIAPHSAGVIEITIPYKNADKYFTKEGKSIKNKFLKQNKK